MLSDRFGRRLVLLIGFMLYVIAAVAVGLAGTFESLLAWRFAHGIAAASMVISRSIIRDLYGGRQMARVMSLTFIVFIMVPIVAPSIGQLVLMLAPWRALFHVFCVFAAVVLVWVYLRLPETLHPEYRMTLTLTHITRAVGKVAADRASLWYTLAVALMFGSIIGYVGMMPQIFGAVFHRPSLMPLVFALCAASMGVSSFLNSTVVERFGMRIISQAGLLIFIVASGLHTLVAAFGNRNHSHVHRPAGRDHELPGLDHGQFRRHGDGADGVGCGYRGVAPRLCRHSRWRSRGRAHRATIQRLDAAAGPRRPALRPCLPGLRAVRGRRPALSAASARAGRARRASSPAFTDSSFGIPAACRLLASSSQLTS